MKGRRIVLVLPIKNEVLGDEEGLREKLIRNHIFTVIAECTAQLRGRRPFRDRIANVGIVFGVRWWRSRTCSRFVRHNLPTRDPEETHNSLQPPHCAY